MRHTAEERTLRQYTHTLSQALKRVTCWCYQPSGGARRNDGWVQLLVQVDNDLTTATNELKAELTTQYAKDKITGNTAGEAVKPARMRFMLIQKRLKINT